MIEEVCTRLGAQAPHELARAPAQSLFAPFRAFAEERFEDTVGHLDRIEVRGIGWQIPQACACRFNRFSDTYDAMGGDVIHDNNIATLKRGDQTLGDVRAENLSIHGTLDHQWRGHSIATQSRYECEGCPSPERHAPDHSLSSQGAAMQTGHVGVHRRLVEEDETGCVKQPLRANPAPTGAGHVRPLLLGRVQDFF